jgi:acyl carrier protein
METATIVEQVRAFVIQNYLFGRTDELNNYDSFLESGIIDSTGVLELVAYLESTYNIKIQDEELVPDNLDSIDNITRYLSSKGVTRAAAEAQVGQQL